MYEYIYIYIYIYIHTWREREREREREQVCTQYGSFVPSGLQGVGFLSFRSLVWSGVYMGYSVDFLPHRGISLCGPLKIHTQIPDSQSRKKPNPKP